MTLAFIAVILTADLTLWGLVGIHHRTDFSKFPDQIRADDSFGTSHQSKIEQSISKSFIIFGLSFNYINDLLNGLAFPTYMIAVNNPALPTTERTNRAKFRSGVQSRIRFICRAWVKAIFLILNKSTVTFNPFLYWIDFVPFIKIFLGE